MDNELNMQTKFSRLLKNMLLGEDGSIEVRQGTRLHADVEEHIGTIVNMKYFNGQLIVVGTNGVVVKVDSSGTVHAIFNDTIAALLPGAPKGWSTTDFVSFAEFNGELIICNGTNKPLLITNGILGTYLNDPATGSNANTPIGRYVLAHDSYLVISGDANNLDRLYISSTDTSGVFVGDPAPNDAVNIDLGSRVPQGSSTVVGLGRFRDKLMVGFANSILIISLGTFDEGDHIPDVQDAIEEQGTISHRVLSTIGEDMLFCDPVGVSSASKAFFTGSVKAERLSYLVDPEIQKDIGRFTDGLQLENRVFALYHSLKQSYMLFIPDTNDLVQTTQTRGFIYRRIKALKIEAWSEYTNWEWSSGTVSALKRVFFSKGTEIFLLGDETDPIYRDRQLSEEMWNDDLPFTDYTGWTPVADSADSGISIPFVWELPWSDNRERFHNKASRYLNLDTEGDETFNVKMFVDNIYDDRDYPGEEFTDGLLFSDDLGWFKEQLDPTLEMQFVGGTAAGFGADGFGGGTAGFGGGRPTRNEQLYAWTTLYKLFKLRVDGDAKGPLKFVSITMAYNPGSIRR